MDTDAIRHLADAYDALEKAWDATTFGAHADMITHVQRDVKKVLRSLIALDDDGIGDSAETAFLTEIAKDTAP